MNYDDYSHLPHLIRDLGYPRPTRMCTCQLSVDLAFGVVGGRTFNLAGTNSSAITAATSMKIPKKMRFKMRHYLD